MPKYNDNMATHIIHVAELKRPSGRDSNRIVLGACWPFQEG
jgi:hypothetical protein